MNRRTSILYLLSIGFLMSTFLIHNNIIDAAFLFFCGLFAGMAFMNQMNQQ